MEAGLLEGMGCGCTPRGSPEAGGCGVLESPFRAVRTFGPEVGPGWREPAQSG